MSAPDQPHEPHEPHVGWKFVISALLFGLFAEWLIPLYDLQEQMVFYQIAPLYYALAGYLILGCLPLPRLIYWASLVLVSLGTWIGIYASYGQSWGDSARSLAANLQQTTSALMKFNMAGIAHQGELRTALLIVGWAMLVSTVQSLAIHRQTAMLFTGITCIYLFIAGYGFGIDMTWSVIRVVTESLLLIAFLRFYVLVSSTYRTSQMDNMRQSWVITSIGIVAVCLLLGWLTSNMLGTRSPQPIPWAELSNRVEHWTKQQFGAQAAAWWGGSSNSVPANAAINGSTGAGRTGYGQDDTALGAAITPDSSIAFQATTPVPTYWRAESKRIYDGRGWTNTDVTWQSVTSEQIAQYRQQDEHTDTPVQQIEQSIHLQSDELIDGFGGKVPVFAGGAVMEVAALSQDEPSGSMDSNGHESSGTATSPAITVEQNLSVPDSSESKTAAARSAVLFQQGGQAYRLLGSDLTAPITDYALKVAIPTHDPAVLRTAAGTDPEEITNTYLQLPAGLPSRIGALTHQIMVGAANRYDQVRAVEQYLRTYYSYTLTDTKVPDKGTDFVDDFLFAQKKGYCTHFSTAMAIMLRTQGIPARWVKGFAPGEASVVNANDYTVRMQDAHAWVEVYFPNIGWVPFEPTPGFQPGDHEQGIGTEASVSNAEGELRTGSSADTAGEQTNGSGSQAALISFGSQLWDRILLAAARVQNSIDLAQLQERGFQLWLLWPYVLGVCGVLCIFYFLSKFRLHLQLKHAIHKFRSAHQDPARIERVAIILWKLWGRRYGERSHDATMREYIRQLRGISEQERELLWRLVLAMEEIAFYGPHCKRMTKHQFVQTCRRTAFINREF